MRMLELDHWPRRVNNRGIGNRGAALRDFGSEIDHTFDREHVGRFQPACGKCQRRDFEVGRQQLKPSIRQFVFDDRGRYHGNAQPFDRHMDHGGERGAGMQSDWRQPGSIEQGSNDLVWLRPAGKGDDRKLREILYFKGSCCRGRAKGWRECRWDNRIGRGCARRMPTAAQPERQGRSPARADACLNRA